MGTILIIDDYQPLLRLYEKEFRKEGYQVVATHCLEEAVEYLQQISFDAVVVEIGSLRLIDFEILVSHLIQHKKVPIIINTSVLSKHSMPSLNQWVSAWVTKSSDLGPLKESLRKFSKPIAPITVYKRETTHFFRS